MEARLRIAFLAAEALPYAKAGGLGDVAGALPRALAARGQELRLILPFHRAVRAAAPTLAAAGAGRIPFQPAGAPAAYRAWLIDSAPGLRVIAIDIPAYFEREGIYTDPRTGKGHADDGERFLAFTLAALDWLAGQGEPVDLLHANDFHTGLAPLLARRHWGGNSVLGGAATVFSIHNLAYQGLFPLPLLGRAGLAPHEAASGSPWEFWGRLNCLKAGILGADLASTVSPRYAEEIGSGPEYGHGLEGVLAGRRPPVVGILNGIDAEAWSPERDPHLPVRYGPESAAEGKAANKSALQAELGLEPSPDLALFGIVSRLVHQKGFDLLAPVADALLALPIQLAVLGTGSPEIVAVLEAMARRCPERLRLVPRFDEGLAHRIEAGADFFLMPSRYEPCGLNQLYSLRYGTLPVVRETGGLADTVIDLDAEPEQGRGFVFREASPAALLDAVTRASAFFARPAALATARRRVMALDFSWERSAGDYLLLYAAARSARRGAEAEVAQRLAAIEVNQARDSRPRPGQDP